MTRYFGAHTLQGEWHNLLPRYVVLEDRVDGKQVLDIGCGTGIGASLLREMGAAGVNGIDHRPEVIELARIKHAKQGLNFRVMFWEELEFSDDTFDLVLCLDPASPVTDPNLLSEIQRVLRPNGEYVCAIERRNLEGFESLLPRYGYDTTGEELELTRTGDRVPQIGQLEELFGTVVSLVQRPRYSYVFDVSGDDDRQFRRNSSRPNDSGIQVGESPADDGPTEAADGHGDRWIRSDDRLTDHDDDPAAIELLFCGDEQMSPPTLREVRMPHRELVERLEKLFSDLQLRQHPDGSETAGQPDDDFEEQRQTSEFEAVDIDRKAGEPARSAPSSADLEAPRQVHSDALQQLHRQLDQMNRMYRQLREEMESLFTRTRRELDERDRYIEQLVDTVHRWKHDLENQTPATSSAGPAASGGPAEEKLDTEEFEREPTNIFERPSDIPTDGNDSDSAAVDDSEPSEDAATDDASSDGTDASEPESAETSENNTEDRDDDNQQSDSESREPSEQQDSSDDEASDGAATDSDDTEPTKATSTAE